MMDQFGHMVYQPHRGFPWHPSAAHAVDVGDPQKVEAKMWHTHFDEELLPPTRGRKREFQAEAPLCGLKRSNMGPKTLGMGMENARSSHPLGRGGATRRGADWILSSPVQIGPKDQSARRAFATQLSHSCRVTGHWNHATDRPQWLLLFLMQVPVGWNSLAPWNRRDCETDTKYGNRPRPYSRCSHTQSWRWQFDRLTPCPSHLLTVTAFCRPTAAT